MARAANDRYDVNGRTAFITGAARGIGKASAERWAAKGRGAYPEEVAYERITIDPSRMSGLPCIRDTRVTVSAVHVTSATTLPSAAHREDYR